MREILFRGFHPCEEGTEKVFIDGKWIKGKWVFGDFVKPCNIVYIAKGYDKALGKENTEICYDDEVIAETVGQFTGLTDKNGTKIFEGDIVKLPTEETGVIRWEEDTAQFNILYDENILVSFESYYGKELEVVGNIHDNPELLEVQE